MEVREKTIELAESAAKDWAMNIFQLMTAKWYCFDRSNDVNDPEEAEKIDTMLQLLYSKGGSKYVGNRGSRRLSLSRDASPAIPRYSTPYPRKMASLDILAESFSTHPGDDKDAMSRPPSDNRTVPSSALGTPYEAQYASLARMSGSAPGSGGEIAPSPCVSDLLGAEPVETQREVGGE
eukprot:1833856-Prymnesium_polylepis.4